MSTTEVHGDGSSGAPAHGATAAATVGLGGAGGAQSGGDAAGRPLRPAPTARSAPGVGYLGILLSLVLTALGVLAVYEGMVLLGWIDATPVLTPVLDGSAAVSPEPLTAALAALAVLVGLWLLWTALRRSRRRGVHLDARTGVWMTYDDLSRLAAGTAEDCDGVLSAEARVTRRRATVHCETTTADVEGAVRAAVQERLSAVQSPPSVQVRVRPRHEQEG